MLEDILLSFLFPQHLCYGSPFLLSLSVSCLIVGNDLSGPPVPPEPRYCLLFIVVCVVPWDQKKLYTTLGPKFFFWNVLAIPRRGLHLFQKLLMIPEALDELS